MKIKQLRHMKELSKLRSAVYMQDTIFVFVCVTAHGALNSVEPCPTKLFLRRLWKQVV